MEKSRFTDSPYNSLVDEIADAMRECDFSEEQILEMRKNANEIDNKLMQDLVNIITGAVNKTRWNYH
jgi:hypothetical protein